MADSTLLSPSIFSPTPQKTLLDPIFLPGSRLPSRLPSPAPSVCVGLEQEEEETCEITTAATEALPDAVNEYTSLFSYPQHLPPSPTASPSHSQSPTALVSPSFPSTVFETPLSSTTTPSSPLVTTQAPTPPKPTLTLQNLPTEILIQILHHLSLPVNKSRENWDPYYKSRLARNLPLLPRSVKQALCYASRELRALVIGCAGYETFTISNIEGIASLWSPTRSRLEPVWIWAKKLNLVWGDSGQLYFKEGVEDAAWELLSRRWEKEMGVKPMGVEHSDDHHDNHHIPPPNRADQINMTGTNPPDKEAYLTTCRAYLQANAQNERITPQPPHQAVTLVEDLYSILSTTKSLQELTLDFPGSVEAFIQVIFRLQQHRSNHSILETLHTLTLRNGTEILFPPPPDLFLAISTLSNLQTFRIRGECGGRDSIFPSEERRRRGLTIPATTASVANAGDDECCWAWECSPILPAKKPKGLKSCDIEAMAGFGVDMRDGDGGDGEVVSRGVWKGKAWPWDEDGRVVWSVVCGSAWEAARRAMEINMYCGLQRIEEGERKEKKGGIVGWLVGYEAS